MIADDSMPNPVEAPLPSPSLLAFQLDELLLVVVLVSLLLAFHVRWSSETTPKRSSPEMTALSPTGSLFASTMSWIGGVYDLEIGRFLYRIPGDPCSLEFSPDSRMLLLAEREGVLKLLEARSGRTIRTWTVRNPPLRKARFHPNGDLVAVEAARGPIGLWSHEDAQLRREIDPQIANVVHISFADTAGLLCVAGLDGTGGRVIQLWDVRTDRPPKILRIPQVGKAWGGVSVSPDGSKVAVVVGEPPLLRLWDVPTDVLSTLTPIPRVQTMRPGVSVARVECMKFSRTGRYIFLELFGGHTALWDLDTRGLKENPRERDWVFPGDVQFLDQDRTVAVSGGWFVEFWDVETFELLREFEPLGFLVRSWKSSRRLSWIGFAIWIALWLLAYRRRRRHPERPTGRRDRGAFLLPFVASVGAVRGESISAVVEDANNLSSLFIPKALEAILPGGLYVLILTSIVLSLLLLILGFTRRFRSRLIFTLPSVGIAAWTIFAAPPLDTSAWSLLVGLFR